MSDLKIKKIWIDPDNEATTLFDDQYQRIKKEHPDEFETFKDFQPHLLIPEMLLIAILEFSRPRPKSNDLLDDLLDDLERGWKAGWTECLLDIREKLIPVEITIRNAK